MCLAKITARKRRTMKEVKAYQVFRWDMYPNSRRMYLHALYQGAKPIRVGHWQQAAHIYAIDRDQEIKADDGTYYMPGFHCFVDLEAAKDYMFTRLPMWDSRRFTIREVLIRKIHTFGTQAGRELVVTSERKILPLSKEIKEINDNMYNAPFTFPIT